MSKSTVRRVSRKAVVTGFGVTTVFVFTAVAAFACVPFKGTLTVTGVGGGNSVTVVGDGGTGGSHKYCDPNEPTSAVTAGDNDVITVAVAQSTECVSKLGQSTTEKVILNNATTDAASPYSWDGSKWVFRTGTGCFTSPAPAGNITLDTAFTVSSTGSGSGTYTLPATLNRVDPTSPTSYASALCVGHGGSGGEGIFAPVRVTEI